MLFGNVPFLSSDISDEKLIKMIKSKKIKFPPLEFLTHTNPISETCQDFIRECLEKNPRYRLGAKNGHQEVLEHAWFKDIDVDSILKKEFTPAFKPELSKDIFDVSNFDSDFWKKPPKLSKVNKQTKDMILNQQEKFAGFDS